MTVILRPLAELRPDADNPRAADPARLALVRLSLRKFGFLLPLVATEDGLLLSGHQRAREAEALGLSVVPVLTIAGLDEARRRGLNILLNRATNDFSARDVQHGEIDAAALASRLAALPDAADPFPCLAPEPRPVAELLATNSEPFDDHMANVAASLDVAGVRYPLVVDPAGRIVNGAGRLRQMAATGVETASCVVVDEGRANVARAVLNTLSMDYAFAGASADLLRFNAFRRTRLRRQNLGSAFVFPLHRGRLGDFDLAENLDAWKEIYGGSVLDFGAGHGDEAALLRMHGIKVTTFEPYPAPGTDAVDAEAGRASADAFLAAVASGRRFSGVVLSSVFNSVPFPEDRAHIVTICAALADEKTTLFAAARGTRDPGWQGIVNGGHLSQSSRRRLHFPLAEPGTLLGDFRLMPKVQKFHAREEFHDLFAARFEDVAIGRHINNVTALCRRPRPVDRTALAAALAFEFDLPYPDGSRMGRVDRALAAFSRRLGVSL